MVNRVILVILVKLVILVNDNSDKYEYMSCKLVQNLEIR